MFCRVTKACEHHTNVSEGVSIEDSKILLPSGQNILSLTQKWCHLLPDCVDSLAVSPSREVVAAGCENGQIALLQVKSGQKSILGGHPGGVLCVQFSHCGELLLTGGQDGRVRLWDVKEAREIVSHLIEGVGAARGGEGSWVEHVACAPEGVHFAAAVGQSVFVFGRSSTGELTVSMLEELPSAVTGLAFLGDGKVAASGYLGVHVWNVTSLQDKPTLLPYRGSLTCFSSSPDGRWAVAGSQEASIRIWLLSNPSYALEMGGYGYKVTEMDWNDQNTLVTNGAAEPIVWDFSGAGPAGTTPVGCFGHSKSVTTIAFGRGGDVSPSILVSGSRDQLVLLWDVSQFEPGAPHRCRPLAGAIAPSARAIPNKVVCAAHGIVMVAYNYEAEVLAGGRIKGLCATIGTQL
ncbi:hypothetical protein CYMTET_23544 [Cymbomonas tetramitiformis]|uniref:Uncharacterized protein n=1 Tax=Cymbomonas tetramitiformis TaxID=36881 RepID=A0AAE0FYA9_9CHLO|nr:hypothetical protein CYMTET_23544 [Cymbomonas tetramitiformis]